MRLRVILLLACLVMTAVAVARADRPEVPPARQSFATFPMVIGDWQGRQEPPFDAAVLKVLGVEDYLTRSYILNREAFVGLYIGYWDSQRQGDTIHSPVNCLPGSGWEPMSKSVMQLPDVHTPGQTVPVNRYVIQKGLDRQFVLYWYQSHGRVLASEYWGKFYLVADAVRTNRTDGSLVRVITPIMGDGPEAEQVAERNAVAFAKLLMPKLDPFLPL